MTGDTTSVSVELYVRSLAPDGTRPPLEAIVERLQRLETAGVIEDLAVYVTGKKVCPDGATARTEPGEFLLGRVDDFETWAERTERSVSGTFRRLDDVEGIDGSDHSGVAFPTMAMAEYENGDLRFVSPTAEGTTVHTVPARLDVLEDGPAEARSDAPANRSTD